MHTFYALRVKNAYKRVSRSIRTGKWYRTLGYTFFWMDGWTDGRMYVCVCARALQVASEKIYTVSI
jgi:hypothetical protein